MDEGRLSDREGRRFYPIAPARARDRSVSHASHGLALAAAVVAASAAIAPAAAAPSAPSIIVTGPEEQVFDDRSSDCRIRLLPDSPARAVRRADGSLVLFATHESNWYFAGPTWDTLRPACRSAGAARHDPDPRKLDDSYWIQALFTLDGRRVVALGSHEYGGSRHPGRCAAKAPTEGIAACWYSSITQYESEGDALDFHPAGGNRIVATPQVPFDRNRTGRVGFLTTSNIVADGAWRYVIVSVDGYGAQKSGNCLFRAANEAGATAWRAWDGNGFTVALDRVPEEGARDGAAAACRPLDLRYQVRGLVRDRRSGTYLAVVLGRGDRRDGPEGVYVAASADLLHWTPLRLVLPLAIEFRRDGCPPVYKYPSLIDHDAPGRNFEEVDGAAYLYLVKAQFDRCRYAGRALVRVPVEVDAAP